MGPDFFTLSSVERKLALEIRDMLENSAIGLGKIAAKILPLSPFTVTKLAYHNQEFRVREVELQRADEKDSARPIDFVSLCEIRRLAAYWRASITTLPCASHPGFSWRPEPYLKPFAQFRSIVWYNAIFAPEADERQRLLYIAEAAKLGSFIPKVRVIYDAVRAIAQNLVRHDLVTERDLQPPITAAEELAAISPASGYVVLMLVYQDLARQFAARKYQGLALTYSGQASFYLQAAEIFWRAHGHELERLLANATVAPAARYYFFSTLKKIYPHPYSDQEENFFKELRNGIETLSASLRMA